MIHNADRAIKLILKHEGGFVDHPSDPGGATNKGITIGTYRRYVKPSATVEDLRKMSEQTAILIYKRHYWDAVEADRLPSGLDYAVADFAVNSGPARAARFLQKIVNSPQDGKIGPATHESVRLRNPGFLIAQICDDRLKFMQGLRHWPTFKNGWSRRVAGVKKTALEWSKEAPIVVRISWKGRLLSAFRKWFKWA